MPSRLIFKKGRFFFYIIVWWLLATGIFLFTYIPATNQIFLKFIIPILFLAVLTREKVFGIDKGLKMYIWLLLWACLSLFYTVDSSMTLRYLQGMIGNVVIWYIAARCIKKIDDINNLSYPLIFSFLIQLYFTLVAPVQASVEEINARLDRVSGLSSNENDQGRLLFFGIIVALLLLLYSRNKILKIVYWVSIVLFFIGIFRTGSRSSLIASLLFFIVFIFLNARKKNYGILIMSIIVGFLLYQYGYDYFLSNTSMGHRLELAVDKRGDEPRIMLLKEGLTFFLHNPVLGLGLGSYVYYSSTHHYSHNDFIEVLASMGIPAFLLYISIFWDYWKRTN
ncbi:MAG TPA: O-antigen ligase family protein, partial [Candidatus Sulfopaludibacter sp.]|nr:O-antigen ligase family protein [Candidatus Sulfopaludibacter sp.]